MYEYGFHKKWVERYGKKVGEKLITLFHKTMDQERCDGREKYEYADNYRICRVGNKEEEAEYKRIYERGCCGEMDWEVEVGGQTYRMGFNYGH